MPYVTSVQRIGRREGEAALLDSADGATRLRAVRGMAERQEVCRSETRSC